MNVPTNVLGTPLLCCCRDPCTGYFRDGYCRTGPGDVGLHTVCAVMTPEFLEFSRAQGNDLLTPVPEIEFPGLQPGDRWCLCVTRWAAALEADVAPPVVLEATHLSALEFVALEDLRQHAVSQATASPAMKIPLAVAFIATASLATAHAQVERVWLSQREIGKLVVCAETQTAAPLTVTTWRQGSTPVVTRDAGGTLHHVEVPFVDEGAPLRYEVRVEGHPPIGAELRGSPTTAWRVAVVADWGYAKQPDFTALLADQPHLLVTAGDNVPSLHALGGSGNKDSTSAYAALIDSQPALFRSVPFLPALGNHDHECRPRGPQPPAEAVYDTEATAFRRFFALPEPEWRWRFDHPRFGARLLALDLHHLQDFGTTWQSSHDFAPDSEQFRWFDAQSATPGARHLVTLQNERSATMRAKPGWGALFARSSAVITGFGYFAERAQPANGPPYFNTSLSGTGSKYPDLASKFLASEDNYLLLTFPAEESPLIVELKALDGRVLDRSEIPPRAATR